MFNDKLRDPGGTSKETPDQRSKEEIFQFLGQIEPQKVALSINSLSIKHITLLFGCIRAEKAAKILREFALQKQVDILYELALSEQSDPTYFATINKIIFLEKTSIHPSLKSGMQTTADILNYLGRNNCEKLLQELSKRSDHLAQEIRHHLFSFHDLLHLPQEALKEIMKHIDFQELSYALCDATAPIQEKFKRMLTPEQTEEIKEIIENKSSKTHNLTQIAKNKLLHIILNLAYEGKITLSS